MGKHYSINVDEDRACPGCGKPGATQTGFCIDCINKNARMGAGGVALIPTRRFLAVKLIESKDPDKEPDKILMKWQDGVHERDKHGRICTKWGNVVAVEWREKARAEFYYAFQALAYHAGLICEILREENSRRFKTKGVTIKWQDDIMGVVISAEKVLAKATTPWPFTTPLRYSELANATGDPTTLLSGDCIDALDLLFIECSRYINHDRAMGDLFPETEAGVGAATDLFYPEGADGSEPQQQQAVVET